MYDNLSNQTNVAASPRRMSYRNAMDALHIEMQGRLAKRQRLNSRKSPAGNKSLRSVRNCSKLTFKIPHILKQLFV
jgi:hypothetical protein